MPVNSPREPAAVKAVGAHIVPGVRHVRINSSGTLMIHQTRTLTENGGKERGRLNDKDRADTIHTSQIGRRYTGHLGGCEVDTEARSVAGEDPPLPTRAREREATELWRLNESNKRLLLQFVQR